MVKWKYSCNICKAVLPNAREVMLHVFFQHPQVAHYATLINTEELPIPKKDAGETVVAAKPKPKVKRRIIEEEELEDEDLSLD